jgi:hypothetical protein
VRDSSPQLKSKLCFYPLSPKGQESNKTGEATGEASFLQITSKESGEENCAGFILSFVLE